MKFDMKNTTDYWYTRDYPRIENVKPIKLDDGEIKKSVDNVNDLIKNIEKQLKSM